MKDKKMKIKVRWKIYRNLWQKKNKRKLMNEKEKNKRNYQKSKNKKMLNRQTQVQKFQKQPMK